MNTAIVTLAVLGAVFCGPGPDGYRRGPGGWGDPEGWGGPGGWGGRRHHRRHHGPPPPPFLRNVTEEARREFFDIMHNRTETIAQQKQDILKWSDKYGIRDQVEEFERDMANVRSEAKKNVTDLIHGLPSALQQFSQIMENENQTRTEQRNALHQLFTSNPKVFFTLKVAMDQFRPRGPRGPRGGPMGGGPGGFGGFGRDGPGEFGGQWQGPRRGRDGFGQGGPWERGGFGRGFGPRGDFGGFQGRFEDNYDMGRPGAGFQPNQRRGGFRGFQGSSNDGYGGNDLEEAF